MILDKRGRALAGSVPFSTAPALPSLLAGKVNLTQELFMAGGSREE
jgi:hypothetical protein